MASPGTRVAVVTDSTAYLPDEVVQEYDVTIVPLQVVIGGITSAEGIDVSPADIAKALRDRGKQVTTSRPSPVALVNAYRSALDAGAAGVVSVHLSARLSGTYDAAVTAAKQVDDDRIAVVDSRGAAMGLGFAVLAAAEAAAAGGDLARVSDAATEAQRRTTTLFYVDTLEHLRRGGRIGAAAALLGTALSVKPILHMADGEVVLKEKVRTASRAIARLEQLAVEAAGDGDVDVAVQHLDAADRADALRKRLESALPRCRRFVFSEVGAAVGAHVGPGLLGVVVVRR
jgi:DegV family protein with EDD domain